MDVEGDGGGCKRSRGDVKVCWGGVTERCRGREISGEGGGV